MTAEETIDDRVSAAGIRKFIPIDVALTYAAGSFAVIDWLSSTFMSYSPWLGASAGAASVGFAYDAYRKITRGEFDGKGYVVGVVGLAIPGSYHIISNADGLLGSVEVTYGVMELACIPLGLFMTYISSKFHKESSVQGAQEKPNY